MAKCYYLQKGNLYTVISREFTNQFSQMIKTLKFLESFFKSSKKPLFLKYSYNETCDLDGRPMFTWT